MTPLERLLAEELPTGTFGDAHPTKPTPRQPPRTPRVDQDRHYAALAAAIGAPALRAVPAVGNRGPRQRAHQQGDAA